MRLLALPAELYPQILGKSNYSILCPRRGTTGVGTDLYRTLSLADHHIVVCSRHLTVAQHKRYDIRNASICQLEILKIFTFL